MRQLPPDNRMRLEVVIPTYNRHDLLPKALASLAAAPVPPGVEVGITVVDNNSSDSTRDVVQQWQQKLNGRLSYVFERKQGRSHALNAGIEATSSDLVGMIDDDEEIDSNWYSRAVKAFQDPDLDFIGGPYHPRWSTAIPEWLPRDYPGVIGWIDGGDKVLPYGPEFNGILMGGNAVFRRKTLEQVGSYSTSLGRSGGNLMSGEDQDMFERLLASGARGLYLPDLIIYHHIPAERLTKSYYRRWCFWNGVSLGVIDHSRNASVAYLLGVPRYLYGQAVRGLIKVAKSVFKGRKERARSFGDELPMWTVAGFFYGKHFHRTTQAEAKS
jgi:glycosyltransferase involved in cell wall biosynthesis